MKDVKKYKIWPLQNKSSRIIYLRVFDFCESFKKCFNVFSIVLDLLGFVCGMFMSFRCSASANEVQTKTIIKTKHKMENQKHNKDPALAKQTPHNFVFMAVLFYLF